MPQRSMTYETARYPICRYGVCPRSHNASIIEFSKCVRRHQVTKLFGFPSQPFCFRKGVTASVRPVCISTMVPYWSNASTLISRFRTSGISLIVRSLPNRTRSVHHNIPILGIGLRFRAKTLLFGCPLWVTCGRRLGKNFLTLLQHLVGCGHVSGLFVRRIWPLALMLCADRVPIESTHFKVR